MSWLELVQALGGVAATAISTALGITVYRNGRRSQRSDASVAADALDAERDDKRWARMESDLATMATKLASAEEKLTTARDDLDQERRDRQTAVQDLRTLLNQYIVRESLWHGMYHDLATQVIDLGGHPKTLPEVLRRLPAPQERPAEDEEAHT